VYVDVHTQEVVLFTYRKQSEKIFFFFFFPGNPKDEPPGYANDPVVERERAE
jgi:hypothetical protein